MRNKRCIYVAALLFDWDGVIVDSIPRSYEGVEKVFGHFGCSAPSFEEYSEFFCRPYADFYNQCGINAGIDEIYAIYKQHSNHHSADFCHEAIKSLKALASRAPLMGIISSNRTNLIAERCEQAGINGLFASIQGHAECKDENILHFCRTHHLEPEETAYVGDFGADMRDAFKAGCVPIGMTNGNGTENMLRRNGAKYCVHSFSELNEMINPRSH